MKVVHKSVIPIQQCRLCKSRIELNHKDIKNGHIGTTCAVWKCPCCQEINKVEWEQPF